jgi:hypothetical protein
MIDDETLRSMLKGMESAAEEALRADPAYYEALRSLKAEIERDPRVRSAVSQLDDAGNKAFSFMTPRIKIRIRTSRGQISLPELSQTLTNNSAWVAHLIQELRSAASSVIIRGRYREMLDRIVNDAIGKSERFDGIASTIEKAGHEIVICLDLSAYAQVREPAEPIGARELPSASEPLARLLSGQDLKFLKDLKISATKN